MITQRDIDAIARTLSLVGNSTERKIGREALNGYRYQRLKIARAVACVQAFRALGGF